MRRGTIIRPVLESRLLDRNPLGDPANRETPVYLPPSYDEAPKRRYPLVLALPGFMSTGRMYLNESFLEEPLSGRLDRLMSSGTMDEAIVVMVDAATRYGGSQYIDSAATGPYGRYTAIEVVAWADSTFRTIPRREARGVFGKSSGGFGAFRMALDFPDVFGAFACHSGDLAFEYCYPTDFPVTARYFWRNNLSPKQFLDSFHDSIDRGRDFFVALNALAMASCYSPNPQSETGFDLPFDLTTGELRSEVWERWLAHDPLRGIEPAADALRRQALIYLDCGSRDEWFLDIGARMAAERMRNLGLPVIHEEFDGGHSGAHHRYDRSLPLLAGALERAQE